MQGARLLGMGTLSFLENLAGGTFIRVGTLIRNCIVFIWVSCLFFYHWLHFDKTFVLLNFANPQATLGRNL